MSVTDSVSDRPEILSVNLRIFTRQSYNIGHVLTTSVLAIRVAFVWETPVRVDGSEALWREALLAPARQASQVFSTKKLICNFLGDELEFPLPSFPCVTRTTPLWEEPLVASLHCAKTSLLYLEDHLY